MKIREIYVIETHLQESVDPSKFNHFRFPGVDYFDVTKEKGRIVLTPVNITQTDTIRTKLAELGVTETDVTEAIAWARKDK